MKRLFWVLVAVPVAVALIVLSVANRQPVVFRLDPFNASNPAIALSLPFFLHLFAAVILGMAIGGLAVWLSQGRYRKTARQEKARARRLEGEAAESRKQAAALEGRRGGELTVRDADRAA